MLKLFDYVKISAPLNSELQARVERILCDNGKEATFTHVCAVADAAVWLAEKFGLDAEVCRTAGLLHDISAVIRPVLSTEATLGLELLYWMAGSVASAG